MNLLHQMLFFDYFKYFPFDCVFFLFDLPKNNFVMQSYCNDYALLNFIFTPPYPKLDIFSTRIESRSLIFFGDIPIDVQLVTFSLLSNFREVSELSVSEKTNKQKNVNYDHL